MSTTGPTRYYKRRRALPILKEDGTLTAPRGDYDETLLLRHEALK